MGGGGGGRRRKTDRGEGGGKERELVREAARKKKATIKKLPFIHPIERAEEPEVLEKRPFLCLLHRLMHLVPRRYRNEVS